ncbi:hypothetical protein [Streptomyces mobaraensis]|nr:hypothetical protein [Streptomyces mobaraensis]
MASAGRPVPRAPRAHPVGGLLLLPEEGVPLIVLQEERIRVRTVR